MDINETLVTLCLTIKDIDCIINSLAEKELSINKLRRDIHNDAEMQLKETMEGFKEEMEDKKIICKDCGKEFTLTKGEQEFYEKKGLSNPVRCKECREAKKIANQKKDETEKIYNRFKKDTVKLSDIE